MTGLSYLRSKSRFRNEGFYSIIWPTCLGHELLFQGNINTPTLRVQILATVLGTHRVQVKKGSNSQLPSIWWTYFPTTGLCCWISAETVLVSRIGPAVPQYMTSNDETIGAVFVHNGNLVLLVSHCATQYP